jgi:hypothetical protein
VATATGRHRREAHGGNHGKAKRMDAEVSHRQPRPAARHRIPDWDAALAASGPSGTAATAAGPPVQPQAAGKVAMPSQQVRAIVSRYQDRMAYFRGLQQLPGSTWTDSTVSRWMVPHLAEAAQALYRLGLDRDQVAGLLAEPSSKSRPTRTTAEFMNNLIRRQA